MALHRYGVYEILAGVGVESLEHARDEHSVSHSVGVNVTSCMYSRESKTSNPRCGKTTFLS